MDHGRLNNGYDYVEIVDGTAAGVDVVSYYVHHHRHSDEPTWRQRVNSGEVTIDGAVAAVTTILHAGQRLCWHKPPWLEPPVPTDVAVLYDDDDLYVVSKPAGLPTLPGAGFLEHTLLAIVRATVPTAAPAHRLDRGTSGIVVFTKTPAAARSLQRQWDRGDVDKRYRAEVVGHVADDVVVVSAPIGAAIDPVSYDGRHTSELFVAMPTGKPSRTTLRVCERRAASTLLDVELGTGRPHQIRIHAAFVGHPLVGDPLYGVGGVRAVGSTARPGDGGFLLHAHTIALTQPTTTARITITAPPPPPLRPHAP